MTIIPREKTFDPSNLCFLLPPPSFCPIIRRHNGPPPGFCPLFRHHQTVEDGIVDIDQIPDYGTVPVCPSVVADIFQNLRFREVNDRPSTKYMEKVQSFIRPKIRSFCVDWIVGLSKVLILTDENVHLSVNYLDRYLSENEVISVRELKLVALACVRIAWKHETDFGFPSMDCFLLVTGDAFSVDEVLQMERSVLDYLKFKLTVPTAVHFLPRFAKAGRKGKFDDDAVLLVCLAHYIADLSLHSYHMLNFLPSVVAASSVFLASYILHPSKKPWNSTLRHYTRYEASELRECVMALHALWYKERHDTCTHEIRKKYSQEKYRHVALRYCLPSIPLSFFYDT